jgi:AcrR family transcriptional regulator
MAKKPSAPAVPIDPKPVIIAAALRLGAERAWSEIALADIAAAAGLGLIELYRVFPSKLAILDGLARQTDAAVLAVPADAGDRPRDRLFDVLMRRFDTLLPSRPALKRIAADMQRLKLETLPAVLALPRSMGWMLEAAGIPASGWRGSVRVRLLGLAYIAGFRVFLDDDSADLTRTMAALDRALRRIEPFLALPPTAEQSPNSTAAQ